MRIFGMGAPELIVILLIVLIVFGPKNLPKLGRSLGNTIKGFRKEMEFDDDAKKSEENQTADEEEIIVEDGVEDLAPTTTTFCPKCGAKVDDDDDFCRTCGKKLN